MLCAVVISYAWSMKDVLYAGVVGDALLGIFR